MSRSICATTGRRLCEQAGFDTERPAAWAAEGLLGFLPPDAQDRLLDNITALSADGSRLVAEVFVNSSISGAALNAATRKWRERGLDIELDNLGFPGDRNDAATYLGERGWRRGSHTSESIVGRQRSTAAVAVTPKRPFARELLLHGGVARTERHG